MRSQPKTLFRWLLIPALAAGLAWALAGDWAARRAAPGLPAGARPAAFQLAQPDPLDGGVAWLNTGGPIKLKELRGKVVVLDFWTYCCINCHHVLLDLARLEEKYKNQLVVIGVHTPKFVAERDIENVRRKVREYGIKHPVVCDSDQIIWNRLGVTSWPTLGVFDPEGNVAFATSGEGHYAELDRVIGGLVEKHRAKGDLNETPVQFFPENEKPDNSPLLFPGKVLADAAGNRLFIADTGHNRVVVTDLAGKNPTLIGGGSTGMTDGAFDKAEFHRPQGMTLVGETLYVADTENHAIRAVDLKAKTVTTVAGTGQQAQGVARARTTGPAKKTALNSPWDLAHVPNSKTLYVAMAGPHQIWRFDTDAGQIGVFAGTGVEYITDGPVVSAAFAQPSGLATDGNHLFVSDSEGSCVRSISLGVKHVVTTLVGEHDVPNVLFSFGDEDGRGAAVRLQHCLGLAYGDGKLYIADTYNNKVKVCDPKTRSVKSLAGDGRPGDGDKPAEFYQPGGLSVAGSKLYVADTNNNKVRVVDLASGSIETLDIASLSPPSASKPVVPRFPNATVFDAPKDAPKTKVAAGKSLTVDVTVPVESGDKLNAEGSMPLLVELTGKAGAVATKVEKVEPPKTRFTVKLPLDKAVSDGESLDLKVSVMALVCSEGSNLCRIKSYVWKVPVTVTTDGDATVKVEPPAK